MLTAGSDTHLYRIAGLRVRADFAIPAVQVGHVDDIDVTITRERVETNIANATERGDLWAYSPQEWYIEPRPELRIGVSEGRQITVEGAEPVPAFDVVSRVCSLAFAVLAIQRELLVLHGSAVLAPDGRAALFLGLSGAGKSTISAFLRHRGALPLADEVAVVRVADGQAHMAMCFPGAKISVDAAHALGWHHLAVLPALTSGPPEVRLPVPEGAGTDEQPVGFVHVVGPRVRGPGLVRRLHGLEAITCVNDLRYQPAFCRKVGRSGADFEQVARMVQTVPVWELNPPDDLARLDEFCARLEGAWSGVL